MKSKLKQFEAWVRTPFGMGVIKIKASSFSNVLTRLSKSDLARTLWVQDEDGESQTTNQILGLDEE